MQQSKRPIPVRARAYQKSKREVSEQDELEDRHCVISSPFVTSATYKKGW